jgi:hypothetical protein
MKKGFFAIALLSLFLLIGANLSAQDKVYYSENHGGALNLGLGLGGYYGYYGYYNNSAVFHINYEFDVANSFTLAPFLSFSSYRYNNYYYNQTIIPIGVKGTYYFDQLLNANSDWDFYLAGSLGFTIVKDTYDNGYYRDNNYHAVSTFFRDLHIGTEYHLNDRLGLFLDLSTGVSTVGLAIH